MFIIISGPSGVGKNTIIEELLKTNKNFSYMLSCTTRPVRENQIGQDYIHLTLDEIKKKIENNELFEYEEVHGNYYGTLNSLIEEMIDGKNFIKDLGVLGQKFFVNKLKDKVDILSVYLTCPKDIIKQRLIDRGEKEVEKRLQRYDFEESHKNNYDLVINNLDINQTLKTIQNKINQKIKQQ